MGCPHFFVFLFLIYFVFLSKLWPVDCGLSMWGKIMIPMYRLWLHSLYGLYGPCCQLSTERPLNLITHSLTYQAYHKYTYKISQQTFKHSLQPGGLVIWHQRSWSILVQVLAWCLMTPNHYLDQCWLIFNIVNYKHLQTYSRLTFIWISKIFQPWKSNLQCLLHLHLHSVFFKTLSSAILRNCKKLNISWNYSF